MSTTLSRTLCGYEYVYVYQRVYVYVYGYGYLHFNVSCMVISFMCCTLHFSLQFLLQHILLSLL
ncbi:hypothetical protein EON63_07300 [archaeon]|nr:MAG: hypothetical protein EON63_07300 [archaeon]